MEEVTIPLVGVHNQRDDAYGALSSSKDQRFINCMFNAVKNSVTGSTQVFVEKRPGWVSGGVVKANARCSFIHPIYQGGAPNTYLRMSDGNLYSNNGISLGAIGVIDGCVDIFEGGKYWTLFCDGSRIYRGSISAYSATLQFTGDTTNTSAVVTNVSVNASNVLYAGMSVSGSGIPADTKILSVDSATQITLDKNATATAAGVTITYTYIASITDSDVSSPNSLTAMDGYVFYGSSASTYQGRIYNSQINNSISYLAGDYVPFNETPDDLLYICRTKNNIVGLGQKSISFFYNPGNPSGSPLSRITGSVINGVGIYPSNAAGWPIGSMNDAVYFVSNPDVGMGVYKLSGNQISKISTPQEDAILTTISSSSKNIVVNCFKLNGYSHVMVNSFSGLTPSAHDVSLVYNEELGFWCEWSGNLHTFIVQDENTLIPNLYAASIVSTDGKIYQIPNTSTNYVWQDDGSAYTMTIQTSKTDFGTDDLKTVWEVALMGSDIQSSGTATLEYSDDDYATWTTAGTFDLSNLKPISRVKAFRNGRAWRLTHSANTAFRAQALKFKFSRGAH